MKYRKKTACMAKAKPFGKKYDTGAGTKRKRKRKRRRGTNGRGGWLYRRQETNEETNQPA